MIDFRVMRDRWTEDGARSVFAELVTQCVASMYPAARSIRPDPGDEGIDTYYGQIDGQLHVWQSKYFCDRVSASQQAQIRKAWKACHSSDLIGKLVCWTLCIPIEMSVEEAKWWQGWKRRESKAQGCQIELWSKTQFVKFYAQPDLANTFAYALGRVGGFTCASDTRAAMRGMAALKRLATLPNKDHLRRALFVRKLEAAGITQHRAARTAFYNFELLRSAIEQGGSPDEQESLVDLQERILDLWEETYNAHAPDKLGRPLVTAVERLITSEHDHRLKSLLPSQLVHKKGGLHYWADLCQAGWTDDFSKVATEDKD